MSDEILFREFMVNFRVLDVKHKKQIEKYLENVSAELKVRGKMVHFNEKHGYCTLGKLSS